MLVRLDSTKLQLTDAPLELAERNADAIAAHWNRLARGGKRFWNGPQFLFSQVACTDGVLSATGHLTDYATFLYWRDHARAAGAVHITGTSLPVTADGAVLAARMAPHTANAGQFYFPAGSLDPVDTVDGRVDIDRNIRRELAEETGLSPSPSAFDPFMVAVHTEHAWFVARRCRLSLSFEECVARVRQHQEQTGDDEIDTVVAIRSPADAEQLRAHARALALWHFDEQTGGGRP